MLTAKRRLVRAIKIRAKTFMTLNAPDLTKQPPRSPRVRLGGCVILPRMLDKGRALLGIGTQAAPKGIGYSSDL